MENAPLKEQEPLTSSGGIFHTSVFKNPDGTYGYDVFRDSQLLVKQKNIPAKQGNAGFADSTKAAVVAGMVMDRIKNGFFPPTIQTWEIDSILNK